jgi:hypothetical protein
MTDTLPPIAHTLKAKEDGTIAVHLDACSSLHVDGAYDHLRIKALAVDEDDTETIATCTLAIADAKPRAKAVAQVLMRDAALKRVERKTGGWNDRSALEERALVKACLRAYRVMKHK